MNTNDTCSGVVSAPADQEPKGQKIIWLPLALTFLFLAMVFLPPIRTNPRLVWTFAGVGAGLLLWQMLLGFTAARERRRLQVEYVAVKSHYVQAIVQLCVYAYWGSYWPKVYSEFPLILAQVIFLYIFDALLSWSRGRAWRLGFGPFPIIFSTNLFLWFMDDWFIFQFLMVATGALGKEFVRWERGGRKAHIFNPSAFGLAVVSLALILTGTSQYTWGWDIATTLGRPRFIYLEVFFLGLIVQGFFGVTLVTLSATATLCLLNLIYTHATGVYFFVDSNIPIAVFLGLHLLVTDPATSPRTNVGKAIFGSLYGLGVWITYAILRQFMLPEYYDKLLVVPFLNLSVLALDRLTGWQPLGKFARWEQAFGLHRLNLLHMACWALLFTVILGAGFIEAPHPGASIAFWQKAAEEGRPHAAENLVTKLTFLAYQGVGDACLQLGQIYTEGKFAKKDPAAAARFFAQAREIYEKGAARPLSPELMRKMRLLLARFGKDVDLDAGLSARLGFTGQNQSWATRQIAGSTASQPGTRHSFSVSRDGNESDILIGLHTSAALIVIRAHPDGTTTPDAALVTDSQTGNTLPLDAGRAQACLNQEFAFWSRIADQLLATTRKD